MQVDDIGLGKCGDLGVGESDLFQNFFGLCAEPLGWQAYPGGLAVIENGMIEQSDGRITVPGAWDRDQETSYALPAGPR